MQLRSNGVAPGPGIGGQPPAARGFSLGMRLNHPQESL